MSTKNGTGIEAFDKKNLSVLRARLDAELKTIGEKFGLGLKLGNCSFSTNFATFKLEASTLRTDGNAMDASARAFQDHEGHAVDYVERKDGLFAVTFRKGDLFREVGLNGGRYKVVGYLPRSQKFPLVCQDLASGKRYKFPAERVANALDREDGVTGTDLNGSRLSKCG